MPTSGSSRPSEMSEAPHWGRDILRHPHSGHARISDKHLQETFTGLEPGFHRVSGSSSSPTFIDICQRTVNATSRLHIQVYCAKEHLVGEINDLGLLTSDRDKGELIDRGIRCCYVIFPSDIVIGLHKPGESTPSQNRGSITLRLKLDLAFSVYSTALKSDNWTGPRTVEDLSRVGVVTKVLQADLDRFGMSPAWSSLFESLTTLVRFGGLIAEVRSTTVSKD